MEPQRDNVVTGLRLPTSLLPCPLSYPAPPAILVVSPRACPSHPAWSCRVHACVAGSGGVAVAAGSFSNFFHEPIAGCFSLLCCLWPSFPSLLYSHGSPIANQYGFSEPTGTPRWLLSCPRWRQSRIIRFLGLVPVYKSAAWESSVLAIVGTNLLSFLPSRLL